MKLLGYQWLLIIILLITILAQTLSSKVGFCWFKISSGTCFLFYFWIILNLLICLWELLIIEHKNQLQLPQENFYLQEYSISDLTKTEFWIESWNQYLKADPRYADPKSKVFRYELLNVLVSCIPSLYVLYHLTSPTAALKEKQLYQVFFFYSILQLVNVFFYFESYFKKYGLQYLGWNHKEETSYLLISFLWIFFPSYLIMV